MKWFDIEEDAIQKQSELLKVLRALKAQNKPVEVPVISGVIAPKVNSDKSTSSGMELAAKGSGLADPILESLEGSRWRPRLAVGGCRRCRPLDYNHVLLLSIGHVEPL